MMWKWLFFFNICLCVSCLLLNPQKPCIPTSTVKGPCHLCVCNTEGVFICHSIPCSFNTTYVNPRISKKDECQAQMTYRYEELFCICSYSNKWMSYNCRETFQILKPNKTLNNNAMRFNISCTPKSLLLIDCNICKCESSGFMQPTSCTSRLCTKSNKAGRCEFGEFLRIKKEICLCSDIGYYIDRLCVKVQEKIVQKINETAIAKITKISQTKKAMNTETCIPHKEYTVDCNRCICDETENLVCPDTACDGNEIINSGYRKSFFKLKQIKNEHAICIPGEKYRIQCNTCICSHIGRLSCTSMECFWKPNLTQIKYKDLPEIQDGQSCIIGKMYKNSCNTCRCGQSNSLICTKMACLEKTILKQKEDILRTKGKEMVYNKNKMEKSKKISRSKLSNSGKLSINLPVLPKGKCIPGKTYSNGCKKCFCDNRMTPICTKTCTEKTLLSKRLFDEDIMALDITLLNLPDLPHIGVECVPGKSYYVQCNLCFCSERRDLYCTMKYCANVHSYEQITLKKYEGQPCEVDYIKQCVSCTCEDNKSSCKILKNCNKMLTGKQLMSDGSSIIKLALDVKKDKCQPNVTYRVHCNDCYCQPEGGLRCTQKVCLTYTQIKDLQKREAYLEKHGL